jgi:hypothetical protein
MSHDKIKAAARKRMAETGKSYAAASVRRAVRSSHRPRGTIGVHARKGTWLANGAYDGLVEITIDPPVRTERSLSSLLRRMKVNALIVSLVDPDGFIVAVERWLRL